MSSLNSLQLQNSKATKESQKQAINKARRPHQSDWCGDGDSHETRDGVHSGKTESCQASNSDKECKIDVGTDQDLSGRSGNSITSSKDRQDEQSHGYVTITRRPKQTTSDSHKTSKGQENGNAQSELQNNERVSGRETGAIDGPKVSGKPKEKEKQQEKEKEKQQTEQELNSATKGIDKWDTDLPRRQESKENDLRNDLLDICFDNYHQSCQCDLGRIDECGDVKELFKGFMDSLEMGLQFVYLVKHEDNLDICELMKKINRCNDRSNLLIRFMSAMKNLRYYVFLQNWYEIVKIDTNDFPEKRRPKEKSIAPREILTLHLYYASEIMKTQKTTFNALGLISPALLSLIMPCDPPLPTREVSQPMETADEDGIDVESLEREVRKSEHEIDPGALMFEYKPIRKVWAYTVDHQVFTREIRDQEIMVFESAEGRVALSKQYFKESDEVLDEERKNFKSKVYYIITYTFYISESENGEKLISGRRLACNRLLFSTLVRNYPARGWDGTRASVSGMNTPAYYMPVWSYQNLTSAEFIQVVKIVSKSDDTKDCDITSWVEGVDSCFVPKVPQARLAMNRIFVRDAFDVTTRAILLMATSVEEPKIYSLNEQNLRDGMVKRSFNRFNRDAYEAHKHYFWNWINKQDFLHGRKFTVEETDFEEYTIDMCKRKRLTVNQTKQLVTIAQSIRFIFSKDQNLLYNVFITYMFDKTKVFVKDEFYPKDSTLRFIISPDPVVKIILGTVFRKIEEWLYFDQESFLKKCNIKKMNYAEVNQKIVEMAGKCSVFLATDYSGYESSQGIFCQRMKFAVYKKFYDPDSFGGIILDLYFKYSISPKKVFNKNFWMWVYSQQMSGFPDTACGNLLLNWINVTFFMLLLVLEMLLEGDDGLLGFASKDDVNVKEALAHSLFPIDEFDFKENPFELSFCGHLQSPNGTPLIADPVYFEQKMCYLFTNAENISDKTKYELMYLRILSAQLLYPRDPHVASLWSIFKLTFKDRFGTIVRESTYEKFCRSHWWQLENGRYLFDYEYIPKVPLPIHEMLPNDFIVGDTDTNNEALRVMERSQNTPETNAVVRTVCDWSRKWMLYALCETGWLSLLCAILFRIPGKMKLIGIYVMLFLRLVLSRFYRQKIRLWIESSNCFYGLFSDKRMADKVRKASRGRCFMGKGFDVVDRLTKITDEQHYTPYDLIAAYRWRPRAHGWFARIRRYFLGDVKYLAHKLSSRALFRLCDQYYATDPEFES